MKKPGKLSKVQTLLLLILANLLHSCNFQNRNIPDNKKEEIRTINLLSEADTSITRISDIALEIEYIPLETNKNSIIKFFEKVRINKDFIYILNMGTELMCFDTHGKFLYKLKNIGRGPGEYTIIGDFDISDDNKSLIFLSGDRLYIYRITGKEFIFLKTINLKHPKPFNLSFVPGTYDILLSIPPWYGNEPSYNVLINTEGDTLLYRPNYYKFNREDSHFGRSIWDVNRYTFENRIFFKDKMSDTVFYIENVQKKVIPWLILYSRGTIISPKYLSDLEYARNNSFKFSQVVYIFEVSRYLFYLYRYNDISHKIVYDKVLNRKNEIVPKDGLIDDISGGPYIDLRYPCCSEGKLYTSIEAIKLKEYVAGTAFKNASVSNPDKMEYLKEISDSIEDTDNPVLIIITPKQCN